MKIELSKVRPNAFNPNVMLQEEYEALVNDTRTGNIMQSIIVRKTSDGYEIVDGFWRYKAAVEAGHKNIDAEIQDMSEDEAMAYCYKLSRERGTIDPIKEGRLFKLDEKTKMSHSKIAKKYGVSRQLIEARLKLADLQEDTVQQFKMAVEKKGAGLDASKLEILAALPQRLRPQLVKVVKDSWQPATVNNLQGEAKEIRQNDARQHKFAMVLAKAQIKDCPTCGAPATGLSYDGELQDKDFHYWDPAKGVKKEEKSSSNGRDLAHDQAAESKSLHSVITTREVLTPLLKKVKDGLLTQVKGLKVEDEIYINATINYGKKQFSVNLSYIQGSLNYSDGEIGFYQKDREYDDGKKSILGERGTTHGSWSKLPQVVKYLGGLGIQAKEKGAKW